jgi:hypothetical protein
MKSIVRIHGILETIILDKDYLIILYFWQTFTLMLDIRIKMLIIYYLQINSQIERINQMIKGYFQAFINY